MSFNSYWKYFWFIAKGWYLRLAVFSICHEIRGDRKYKIRTTGIDDLKGQEVTGLNKAAASIYQPANYYLLEKSFDYLQNQDVKGALVDFGCGKGRVMVVAAYYGFKVIRGVEFAVELAEEARKNLKLVQPFFPETEFDLQCKDAADFQITGNDTCFVLFNPFNRKVLITVVKNIIQSLNENPRDCFVLYLNPVDKEVFRSAGFIELWYFRKMEYLDFSILYREKQDYDFGPL